MQNSIKLSGKLTANVKESQNGKTLEFSIYRSQKNIKAEEGADNQYDVCFTQFRAHKEVIDQVKAIEPKTMVDVDGFMSFYKNKEGKMIPYLVAKAISVTPEKAPEQPKETKKTKNKKTSRASQKAAEKEIVNA